MGLFDRIKNAFSNPKPEYPSPPSSSDPCEDQTFAPRFKEKKINVFVSSTFRDMIAERDELTLKIFPALRKECEQRGIAWSEVDLRWGTPPEKSEQGEAVRICLQYIDKCRPYFIGMLGERYGWVDPDAPEKVKGDFPWVQERADKSITELEILHGVLNNPNMEDHAYFYFRDRAYLESEEFKANVPEADRAGFFESEDIPQQKLVDLKGRIRRSGFPVREDYPNPGVFGEMVKNDLLAIIEFIAPSSQEISEEDKAEVYLDRDLAAHETFVASRFGVYIRRMEYFDRLNAHASEDGEPLVVVGESGSGKSALLAHWAFAYQANHTKDLVLFHFVGATSSSTDWAMMLRRIMGELKRGCGIETEVPMEEEELRPAFVNFLSMAGQKRKVVLIIDALNQLEDQGGALDLTWLPPKIPGGVRLIVSTLSGKSLETARKRDFSELEVHPLTNEEQSRLITCYFKQFHKEPSSEMITELVRSEQCRNPLYLRAVLEEIRIHGVYERLVDQITDLLSAKTIPALYEKILARYERDYEHDRPGLVRDLCRLVWASRRGLSRDELRGLLGADDQPLPDAYWAPLLLAMQHGLVEKGDVLTFFHDYLREAVQVRYLPNEAVVTVAHLDLADYFEKQLLGPRQVEELPWQLAAAGAWDRLVALLTEPRFFSALYTARKYDLMQYWVKVVNGSSYGIVDGYTHVVRDPSTFPAAALNLLQDFFIDTGHLDEAITLGEYIIHSAKSCGDQHTLQLTLGKQAAILMTYRDHDGALNLLKEQERICHELGNNDDLQASLRNQSENLIAIGDLNGGMKLKVNEFWFCHKPDNPNDLQAFLGNRADFLMALGDLENSLQLFIEQERICRDLGNLDGLEKSLGNQALIFMNRGDLDSAMQFLKEQESICREIGLIEDLAYSLANQAVIHIERVQRAAASSAIDEASALADDHGYASLSTRIRFFKYQNCL